MVSGHERTERGLLADFASLHFALAVKEDSLKRLKAAGDLFSIGEKKPPWWF